MFEEMFIIKPLNPVFFISLLFVALFAFAFIRIFRKKDLEVRKKAVAVLYIIAFVLFILYKVFLYFDPDYSSIRLENGLGPFNWWDELPLNLCNINIMLIVVGVLTGSRLVLSMNFFTSLLGALLALLMPAIGFSGYSFFLPRMLGYYITHFLVLIEMPILSGLSIYRPKYRDLLPACLFISMMAALVTFLNLILRTAGLSPDVNYFYTVDPEGNPILELFHRWIPIPGFYMLPGVPILLGYMLLVTSVYRLFDKKD